MPTLSNPTAYENHVEAAIMAVRAIRNKAEADNCECLIRKVNETLASVESLAVLISQLSEE